MNVLQAVHQEQLPQLWPWLRVGLAEVVRRFKPEWIPEDVYAAVQGGRAVLFVIGERQGFCVLERQRRSIGPTLFVWVLWGKVAALEAALLADLETLARDLGARSITCNSPRKGWARRGFTARAVVYERAVP